MTTSTSITNDLTRLADDIKRWGRELGFADIGITDTDLSHAEEHHQKWVKKGFHGEMDYMAKHGTKRTRPAELIPNTARVITARLDYLPPKSKDSWQVMNDGEQAFISRYTLGRDYHKVVNYKNSATKFNKLHNMLSTVHLRIARPY